MSELQLHNTLTGKKDVFKPIKAGQVGLYVCGITPYDETHVGHARCYVVFDTLKRVLVHHGYKVTHIQNFTDVDDKIIKRAQELNVPSETYPKQFMESFKTYMGQLGVIPPDHYPLVTTHMKEIIQLIEKLVASGVAYTLEGDVYYSVRKFKGNYVELSKRNLADLESGARVSVDERKKDPLDFALWKTAKPGEPLWDSPWGKGRPGWHIECSAMSMKYLGEEFDIHGGGLDLIFPHHTNEIAQSEGATGKKFARVWMHNGFVTVNQEKMSKSLGNFFTLKDVLAKYDPMVVRYFLLSTHYRSPLNFSDHELDAAKKVWVDRISGAYRLVKNAESSTGKNALGAWGEFESLLNDFDAGLSQDLSTPTALAALNDYCSRIFGMEKGLKDFSGSELSKVRHGLDRMLNLLGLTVSAEIAMDPALEKLLKERDEARKSKNWTRSDEIRKELMARGVMVEDTPSGPRLKKVT